VDGVWTCAASEQKLELLCLLNTMRESEIKAVIVLASMFFNLFLMLHIQKVSKTPEK